MRNFKIILFILSLGVFSPPHVSAKLTLTKARSFVYENTVCHFKECCIDSEIPGDVDRLEMVLNENVFGQHIAIDTVIPALRAHLDKQTKVKKALTFSFHGLPGSGKNYVANFVAESLYKNGLESNFVHYFVGRRDFGLEGSFLQHKQNPIYNWIVGNLTLCPKRLFIFDEVDKMPPRVLNSIKPLIDFGRSEQSIFIFISNTAEYSINKITNDLWKMGVKRESISMEDYKNEIVKKAFDEDGGFHHSDIIRSGTIDHFVPFMPLQVIHVEQCVLQEFKKRNVKPTKEDIYYFLNLIEWNSDRNFAKSGCKRIPQKVASYIKKHYRVLKAH